MWSLILLASLLHDISAGEVWEFLFFELLVQTVIAIEQRVARNMAQVQGRCDARFAQVKRLFEHHLNVGNELGASIAVNLDGEQVVHLWGGHVDPARSRPWQEDTITNTFSATKTVTAMAALVLMDRGQLDPQAKVSSYWPEFGQKGKDLIEVRHVLSHTSGVAGWDKPVTVEDVLDFEKSTKMLEEQTLWWEPGSASGYHAFNYGHLVGELVRRATGKSLKDFIAQEIAGPLDADFQLGARHADWSRVSDVVVPPPPPSGPPTFDPSSLTAKVFGNPVMDPGWANTSSWKEGEVGAGNGHTNALGLCKILSVLTLGGNGTPLESTGKPFFTSDISKVIFQEQARGPDLVLGLPLRFGIGFGLSGPDTFLDYLPAGQVCFWGGYGGSVSF